MMHLKAFNSKTIALADGLIEGTSSMLDEIESNSCSAVASCLANFEFQPLETELSKIGNLSTSNKDY